MFAEDHFKEGKTGWVEIDILSPENLQKFLKYIYTDKVKIIFWTKYGPIEVPTRVSFSRRVSNL